MISDPMIPIGTSRCGFFASSAWVRDGVEPDVREENDRRAGDHAGGIAVGVGPAGHLMPEDVDPGPSVRGEVRPSWPG